MLGRAQGVVPETRLCAKHQESDRSIFPEGSRPAREGELAQCNVETNPSLMFVCEDLSEQESKCPNTRELRSGAARVYNQADPSITL